MADAAPCSRHFVSANELPNEGGGFEDGLGRDSIRLPLTGTKTISNGIGFQILGWRAIWRLSVGIVIGAE